MSLDTAVLRGLGRRRFLAGVGAATTGLTVGAAARPFTPAAHATGPLVRRDIWSLASPWNDYTVAYARAVGLMQGRAPEDPTSWYFQAAIHGSFVQPAHATWNQCQHQTWFFLPWHRMYLYYFERIVRAAVAQVGGPEDWALPYWNYDQAFPANTLPSAFRTATLPDGTANPLHLPTKRSTAMMQGFELAPRTVTARKALRQTAFTGDAGNSRRTFGGGMQPAAQFGSAIGALEVQPHNGVHTQVGSRSAPGCTGGWMSAVPCAANDPIFWLHHSNIDRLWNVWLAQGRGRANPTDAAWRDQAFTLFDENGQAVSISVAQVLDDAGQLGYSYA